MFADHPPWSRRPEHSGWSQQKHQNIRLRTFPEPARPGQWDVRAEDKGRPAYQMDGTRVSLLLGLHSQVGRLGLRDTHVGDRNAGYDGIWWLMGCWYLLLSGSTPYPGMGAREVMRKVRDGYRLERPGHCHPDLYHIIQKCWAGDMNKRPDFSELRKVSHRLVFVLSA